MTNKIYEKKKTRAGFLHLNLTETEYVSLRELAESTGSTYSHEIIKTLKYLDYSSLNINKWNRSEKITLEIPRATLNKYLDSIPQHLREPFTRFLIELTIHRIEQQKNKSVQDLNNIKV